MVGSGLSSMSLSFGSSIAPYTGSAKTFTASEIERAADNFDDSRILGEGGFGRVYSGVLDDGTKVAVKVLKRDDQQGGREFLAEVEMLSRLHHRNLVKLIGICTEERNRCLVYELIPNGSVESHLHGVDKESAPLDWDARIKIALGAARGLAYLHEDSSPRVIHRDFKSSNILLEHDFTPKVSDFGLARTAMDEEGRHISTRVMGTFGYVAPEYAMTGHLLVKSDVYSYGVVLLELLTGRKPVDMTQPPGQENLVAWARPLLATKEGLETIIDPSLGSDVAFQSVAKVAAIASMCVQPEVSHRPFMGEVVQALKLVCNECDEAKEVEGSRGSSRDDFSIDMDGKVSTGSGRLSEPLQSHYSISNYVSGLDTERGLSVSDLFSSSTRFGRQSSESFRRHGSSGPLRTGRGSRFWQKMQRLSRGSISEHGVMMRFWTGSH
ncbi:Receptor-like serine/threonine-protein kinase ALE2 [Hibiscus syriacus]|uniref:Receptor-like serine/threonine-protein kinase ALE2 n=2 Tax=Hibiscus syriacus TaxID=106335 RepID=A0A6A2YH52_HIBSY|nr:Receptor-like serine/threonine-protein kinase ALE2 [Hibiscus syriacus]